MYSMYPQHGGFLLSCSWLNVLPVNVQSQGAGGFSLMVGKSQGTNVIQAAAGAPCAGEDLGCGCISDKQETLPNAEMPSLLFLQALTAFSAAARMVAKVSEERARKTERKGDFQQCYSRRGRHLTCHTHLEKSPLPPQQQPMQIHLNMSIFTTQPLEK